MRRSGRGVSGSRVRRLGKARAYELRGNPLRWLGMRCANRAEFHSPRLVVYEKIKYRSKR